MDMPRVTSEEEARQEEHVLEGLGAMGVAHTQHRIVAAVPEPKRRERGPESTPMQVWVSTSILFCLFALDDNIACTPI